ncbi:virulence factor Mce family protein [Mycobacterium parascrofulaceum ATCC BAA-614]|uniref:Virulence factor Mce family protein n=1 Tax=Mycobacterium parascrofulaceum ATCC BAA-614 TaxID=525368 RepID=D5PAN6_9MYCO|nr:MULTISPECIES: MlaD family protein [Mycobacterium]EFG76935.1 virulence factor Mce family protein [Mycobacterium parascrofulaceum ATCC BAA-614]OCB44862.1 mammalian cell entry protein [Mycobacterium malmoense]
MLTPFIRRQLIAFGILTVISLLVLGVYYLQLPSLAGIGRYTLKAELPASGGLYPTANVTYRGITIGKVTDVEPTERGAEATMSIDSRYKIPTDATANVHSVSAVGEQYLDLESTGNPGKFLSEGQTITKGTVPAEIGPALDTANRGLAVLPKDKIAQLLDETAQSVGGLGPALQRLVDSTQAIVGDFKTNITEVNDIIQNSGPVLDSQVKSSDAIERWARNLNRLGAQSAQEDAHVKSVLRQAAPTADQINDVFNDVRESLPQTLANLEVVFDLLKRYHAGVEQLLVFLPQGASIVQTVGLANPNMADLDLALPINQPPPCLTGFIPASEWRSPADTSIQPLPSGTYCKIPMDTPANGVRGSRNMPCVDVPGKRAATPRECRDPKPYVPAGTNPWYGDPNQILTCPAPAARCDQPVKPGQVIPAPSIDTGLNPAPSDRVAGTPPPTSDPLSRPGSGTVQCNGQQPNPCVYTPSGPPVATYSPQSGELVGPDGVKYSVENSARTGDDGWKEMLAPAG